MEQRSSALAICHTQRDHHLGELHKRLDGFCHLLTPVGSSAENRKQCMLPVVWPPAKRPSTNSSTESQRQDAHHSVYISPPLRPSLQAATLLRSAGLPLPPCTQKTLFGGQHIRGNLFHEQLASSETVCDDRCFDKRYYGAGIRALARLSSLLGSLGFALTRI